MSSKDSFSISEITPEGAKWEWFGDDLCKVSFSFLKTRKISILYIPSRNMFNATKLLNNNTDKLNENENVTKSQYNINQSSEQLAGVDPHQLDLATADQHQLKNTDEIGSWIGINRKQQDITSFLRSIDNIHYIDRISYLLTGQTHFLTKSGEIIWLNGNIRSELMDSSSNVKLSELVHRKDNILEIVKNGPTITWGTWMNYEFLPKILNLIDEDYEILSNHYQALILPLLTSNQFSLEEETNSLENISLIKRSRREEIKSIQSVQEKGHVAEMEIMKQLKTVFEYKDLKTGKQYTVDKCRYHSCDISLMNGEILVEVKAVQSKVKADEDKFIKDLTDNVKTVHMGVYINIFDEKTPSHIETCPLRFYINPNDFTINMLKFIRATNQNINREIKLTRQANELYSQLLYVESFTDKLAIDIWKKIELLSSGLFSRLKLNNYGNENTLQQIPFRSDATTDKKLERDIKRSENLNKIDELTKSFITQHYNDIKFGYHSKTAKSEFDQYLINNGLPNMGDKVLTSALGQYLYIERNYSMENGPNCYFFSVGKEDEFKPAQSHDVTVNIDIQPPSREELLKTFLSKPDISKLLNRKSGIQQESVSKKFSYFVEKEVCPKFNVTKTIYTQEFGNDMLKDHIQVYRSGKRWYIPNNSAEAKNILSRFDEILKEELKRDHLITYEEFKGIYKDKMNNNNVLTKSLSQRRFNEIKASYH